MHRKLIFLIIALSMLGCGGGGGDTPTSPTQTPANVSFSASIQPIFNSSCTTNCHSSGGTASFLLLSRGNLVDQPSTRSGGGTLVIPGNSSNSILYKRISGTSVGTQMPQLSTPLSQNEQQLIKVWIDEGAKDN